MLIVGSALLATLLAFAGVLWYWSPGSPEPYVDAKGRPLPGSISEKIHISLNGVDQ